MATGTGRIDLSYLQAALEEDSELRESIKVAVKGVKAVTDHWSAELNRAHSLPASDFQPIVDDSTPFEARLQESISQLAQLVPQGAYYRYSFLFSNALQSASFAVVFSRFLKTGTVWERDLVAFIIGLKKEWEDRLFLSTEDYLHSLITLVNELSRLAINKVTLGDYSAPLFYSRFAKELSAGFGMLNLKNDALRKRSDSIKYDVKRLEEVVYDLSLRGLVRKQGASREREDEQEEQGGKRVRMEE